MITPSFGLTATERILPRLTVDFTTASLDPCITFTRSAATATVINSSGYVVDVAADIPRFDYDPVTLACRGLLIEGARTNLVSASESFATWAAINVSAATDTTKAPDNTTLAEKIVPNTTSTTHLYQLGNVFVADGNRRFWSVYVKNGGYRYVAVGPRTFAATTAYSVFDTNTGTWTHTGSGTYTANLNAVQMPNGWWRISFSSAANTTSDDNFNIGISIDGTAAGVTFAGNGTDGIYAWGAQVELGEFLTSYIPTSTGTVTRNPDIATMTGTNFSSWFNASEGGIVVQGIPKATSGIKPVIQFDDATANEIIALRGNVADPQLYVVDGGVAQATLDAGTITANSTFKLAGAWKSANFAAAINGGATASQSSGTYPTVTQARLGSDGTDYFNGWLQNFRYWPQRIINAEAQAFSK